MKILIDADSCPVTKAAIRMAEKHLKGPSKRSKKHDIQFENSLKPMLN